MNRGLFSYQFREPKTYVHRDPVGPVCGARLSLSMNPLGGNATSNVLHLVPYTSNQVCLLRGSRWVTYRLPGIISARTTHLAANTVYDVFLDYTNGLWTLFFRDWQNNTQRVYKLVDAGFALVNSDNNALYLGTIRTTSAGVLEDNPQRRLVWNAFNALNRSLFCVDSTYNWFYSQEAWRHANNNPANQIEVVCGIGSGSFLDLSLSATVKINGGGQSQFPKVAISERNNALVPHSLSSVAELGGQTSPRLPLTCHLKTVLNEGWSYFAWIEYGSAVGSPAPEFLGGNASFIRNGLFGSVLA